MSPTLAGNLFVIRAVEVGAADYAILPIQGAPWGPSSKRAGVIVLVLVIAVGVSVIGYFVLRKKEAPPASAPQTPAAEAPAPAPKAIADAGPLPPLEESDTLARELARRLSSHPRFLEWLATKNLIRTVTVVVSNLAEGVSPTKHVGFLAPEEKFGARRRGGRLYVDPRSYGRYDTLAGILSSLDAEGCASAYEKLKPLFDAAYRELGHPEGNFDAPLEQAMRQVFETPVVEGDVALEQPGVAYEYADPALERLTTAQKHFLRMGPHNLRLVEAKVREVALRLGMKVSAR